MIKETLSVILIENYMAMLLLGKNKNTWQFISAASHYRC
jgi:hypothetical protein